MIVDTSALMAILLSEPDAYRYEQAMTRGAVLQMSAGSLIESPPLSYDDFPCSLQTNRSA